MTSGSWSLRWRDWPPVAVLTIAGAVLGFVAGAMTFKTSYEMILAKQDIFEVHERDTQTRLTRVEDKMETLVQGFRDIKNAKILEIETKKP